MGAKTYTVGATACETTQQNKSFVGVQGDSRRVCQKSPLAAGGNKKKEYNYGYN